MLTRFCALTFLLAMLLGVSAELRERSRYQTLLSQMQSVRVTANLPGPIAGQEAIDLAMTMYTIDRADGIRPPVFDPRLEDRGLAVSALLTPIRKIQIGTEGFSSWGILGSTLAHEIEVHGRQSFAGILFLDVMTRLAKPLTATIAFARGTETNRGASEGLGTWAAERAAYTHEIKSAARFGLTADEVHAIRSVRDFFYP